MRLGTWGENLAANYLEEQGYECLDRNIRIGPRELDLVMQIEDTVVFVEVKTRVSAEYGPPEAAISQSKRRNLVQAAWGYLEQVDRLQAAWRFDEIAIEATRQREVIRLDHYPAAFEVGML